MRHHRDAVEPSADHRRKGGESTLGEHHLRAQTPQQPPRLQDADGNAKAIRQILKRQIAPQLAGADA